MMKNETQKKVGGDLKLITALSGPLRFKRVMVLRKGFCMH